MKQALGVQLQHLAVNRTPFVDKLKQSEFISVYKKLDALEEEKYRPVTMPPLVSKAFETFMCKIINVYAED